MADRKKKSREELAKAKQEANATQEALRAEQRGRN